VVGADVGDDDGDDDGDAVGDALGAVGAVEGVEEGVAEGAAVGDAVVVDVGEVVVVVSSSLPEPDPLSNILAIHVQSLLSCVNDAAWLMPPTWISHFVVYGGRYEASHWNSNAVHDALASHISAHSVKFKSKYRE
jgi:hypothetical protein